MDDSIFDSGIFFCVFCIGVNYWNINWKVRDMNTLFDNNGGLILDQETKENIIKQYLAISQRQSYNPQENDTMTELTCICGGFLVQRPRHSDNDIMASAERVIGEIPKHKKTRIQKKWRKRWAEKAGPIILGLKLAAIMGPPTFICSKCGKQEGFYSAIGRNMIRVEPLTEEQILNK